MARAEKGQPAQESTQLERFKEAARALGCDDDEAAFDDKLKVIAGHKPLAPKAPKAENPRQHEPPHK